MVAPAGNPGATAVRPAGNVLRQFSCPTLKFSPTSALPAAESEPSVPQEPSAAVWAAVCSPQPMRQFSAPSGDNGRGGSSAPGALGRRSISVDGSQVAIALAPLVMSTATSSEVPRQHSPLQSAQQPQQLVGQTLPSKPTVQTFAEATFEQMRGEAELEMAEEVAAAATRTEDLVSPNGAMDSCRSAGSTGASGIADVTGETSLTKSTGFQGVARCALCQGLLQVIVGTARHQALLSQSDVPAASAELAERALAFQMSEDDEAVASATMCRFHQIHKQRYEVWMKCYAAIKRQHVGRMDRQALERVQQMTDLMAQLEAKARKAEHGYAQAFADCMRKLHQDMHDRVYEASTCKARELIENRQQEIEEVDAQIRRKLSERRSSMAGAIGKVQDAARQEFWRQHQRRSSQKLLGCVDSHRQFHTGVPGSAAAALKELVATQQAGRRELERQADSHIAARAEREAVKRERETNVWLGKMEQLQTLHHLQATKVQERELHRVEITMRRLEEEQTIEFRQVLTRLMKHIVRLQHMLGRPSRLHSLRLRGDAVGHSVAGSVAADCSSIMSSPIEMLEPFVYAVMRCELAIPKGKTGDVANASALDVSASCGADSTVASLEVSTSVAVANERAVGTMELCAFAEFLGMRFPTLRAALSAMDMTRTGRVVCFELNSWLRDNQYPGDARALLKDLDRRRQGHITLEQLRPLAASFTGGGLQCGRPPGTVAAAVSACLNAAAHVRRKDQVVKTVEVYANALRCTAHILSFVSPGSTQGLPSTGGTPEAPLSLIGGSTRVASIEDLAGDAGHRQSVDVGRRSRHMLYTRAEDRHGFMRHASSSPERASGTRSESRSSSARGERFRLDTTPRRGPTIQDRGPFFHFSNARCGGAPPPRCAPGAVRRFGAGSGSTPGDSPRKSPRDQDPARSSSRDRRSARQRGQSSESYGRLTSQEPPPPVGFSTLGLPLQAGVGLGPGSTNQSRPLQRSGGGRSGVASVGAPPPPVVRMALEAGGSSGSGSGCCRRITSPEHKSSGGLARVLTGDHEPRSTSTSRQASKQAPQSSQLIGPPQLTGSWGSPPVSRQSSGRPLSPVCSARLLVGTPVLGGSSQTGGVLGVGRSPSPSGSFSIGATSLGIGSPMLGGCSLVSLAPSRTAAAQVPWASNGSNCSFSLPNSVGPTLVGSIAAVHAPFSGSAPSVVAANVAAAPQHAPVTNYRAPSQPLQQDASGEHKPAHGSVAADRERPLLVRYAEARRIAPPQEESPPVVFVATASGDPAMDTVLADAHAPGGIPSGGRTTTPRASITSTISSGSAVVIRTASADAARRHETPTSTPRTTTPTRSFSTASPRVPGSVPTPPMPFLAAAVTAAPRAIAPPPMQVIAPAGAAQWCAGRASTPTRPAPTVVAASHPTFRPAG